MVLQPGAQHVGIQGAVDAHQPADAKQGKRSQAERRVELDRENDQQRKTLGAIRQAGGDQPQRLQRSLFAEQFEFQLQGSGILSVVAVKEEEPATGQLIAVDHNPHPVGRLKAEIAQVEEWQQQGRGGRRRQVGGAHIHAQPDLLHGEQQRPQTEGQVGGGCPGQLGGCFAASRA